MNSRANRILFPLLFCVLLPGIMSAQEELTFVAERDTVAFRAEDRETLAINAGDLVVTRARVGYGRLLFPSEFHLTTTFGEPGMWYLMNAKDFLPLDTEYVFGDDIFIDYPVDRWDPYARQSILDRIAIGDTDAMWVPAYYRDILMGQSRDMLLEMVPALADLACRDFMAGITDDGDWYDNTQADIQRGRAMFYNSVIRLGTGIHLAVRNIRRTDFGYMVDSVRSVIDRHSPAAFIFLHESAFWDSYRPGNAVTLLLHLDGDYLDIYTYGSDIHVTTLIRVDREFIAQYQSLIRTNTADLTNVQWPRRADGGMSVAPPVIVPNNVPDETMEELGINISEGQEEESVAGIAEDQAFGIANAIALQENTGAHNGAVTTPLPPWAPFAIIGVAVLLVSGAVLFVVKRKR